MRLRRLVLTALVSMVLASLGSGIPAAEPTLAIVMTPSLAAVLFGLTIVMCSLAAVSAIVKVTRIDPGTVFSR